MLCLWLALGAGCATRATTVGRPHTAKLGNDQQGRRRPTLVLLVIVDQLPWRRWQWLARDGLRALPASHAWHGLLASARVSRLRYPYAVTLTAPGHATLSTGRLPAEHGVTANGWYDRAARRYVEATRVAGAPSAKALRGPTLLQSAQAAGLRAHALSLKDRGALMLASEGVPALWLDRQTGHVRASHRRPWHDAFSRAQHPARESRWRDAIWTPLSPPCDPARSAQAKPCSPTAPPAWAAVDYHGLGRAFPHPLRYDASAPQAFYASFGATPFAATWLTELAIEVIARERPRLLTVSYSAIDLAGHLFGADSPEHADHLLRLGDELQRLWIAAQTHAGAGRVALLLTSDHGMPEVGPREYRIPHAEIDAALATAGFRKAALLTANLYLARDTGDAAPPGALERARDALARVPGFAHVFTRDEVAGAPLQHVQNEPTERAAALALLRASFDPARAGDLLFVLRRGYSTPKRGVSHGSPWDYDRDVPLVLVGPYGCLPSDAPVDATSVAPSLADLIGVSAPAGARGRAWPTSCGAGTR